MREILNTIQQRGLIILFLVLTLNAFGQYPKTSLEDFTLRSGVPSQNSKTFSSWDSAPYQDGVVWSRKGPNASDVTSKINFRLLKPNGYSSGKSGGYPMIVHLAGCNEAGRYNCSGKVYTGASYDDNDKQLSSSQSGPGYRHLKAVKENRFPGFVLFPQADYSGWENGIHNATSVEIKKVIDLVERISEKYNINKSKVYIHGISNGGKGVWDIISRRPDLFAAAMPMSSSSYDIFSQAGHMPIWVFHGRHDNIFSANGTKQGVEKMNSKGGQVKYSEYATGHSAWSFAYKEGDFYSWLLAQDQRKIYPFFKRTKIGGSVNNITLGIAPGFDSYQWYKDGKAISGANSNRVTVYSNDKYFVKFKRDGKTVQSFTITLGEENPPVDNGDDCTTNIAKGKSSSQSSTYFGRNASKANDNNTNGESNKGSVSMTQSQNQAWWELDLGKVYDLKTVKISNRTDCCKERLNQHYLFVSEKSFSSQQLDKTINQTGVSKYFVATASDKMTHNVNRKGRYIRVQLKYKNFLSLAEVEVFSCSNDSGNGDNGDGDIGGGDNGGGDNGGGEVTTTPEAIYRINAGGENIYSSGVDWATDTRNNPHPYLNSNSTNATSGWNVKNEQNSTSAPASLFGTQRYDGKWGASIKYHFPVSDGTYDLRLYFAEKPETNPYVGQRVFGIKVEEKQILNGFDIFKSAGKGSIQINYQVIVNDGKLTVELTREKGEPLISGLEVISYQGSPPPLNLITPKLAVYPNPASKWLRIDNILPSADGILRIMDQSGRSVLEQSGFKDYIVIDLDQFASGIYNVILQSNEQVQTTRFVKE